MQLHKNQIKYEIKIGTIFLRSVLYNQHYKRLPISYIPSLETMTT